MLRELAELTQIDEGNSAIVPGARLRSRGAGDLRAGNRPREVHPRGAPADRGHRQEHRREDPRAARDRPGGEARGAAPEAPGERGRAAAHPGPGTEGAREAARRARRKFHRRPAPGAGRAPRARARGLRREVRGEARPRRRQPGCGALARADADLDRPAPRAARRRAPARGARGDARLVLRLAAPLLRDDRGHRHRGGRERARAGDGRAGLDELRRARARTRGVEDERGHPPRSPDRPAGGGGAPARRRAPLLHRIQGPQHQAPPARARPRPDAQRIRALPHRGRRNRGRRERRADLPGARPALHPAGAARGRRRDRGRRERPAPAVRSAM